MTDIYLKDPTLNLYQRADFAGIAYCDGEEAERRIGDIVSNATDRSVFSAELVHAITDWPSEYHLSRQRHCLLRPLDIAPGARVLELGCGCGGLTRYLGEIGAQVTAVEGSPARARIAATRCSDLPNVTVIAEDLLRFVSETQFDWVLLVGVLEYAPVFSPEPDAALHYLQRVTGLLAPQGRLVVAIENKLGMKYFNGCGEDHLGVPFSGVQGLYGANTPRTFGRRELQSQLNAAGFSHVAFHYPFPDYKLPQVILSDAALADPLFNPVDMLALIRARDYAGLSHRLFDEALVLREAARNGLLGELSNSFLVVSSQQAPDQRDESSNWALAASYAVQRVPEFTTQTRFVRRADTIHVQKEALHKGLPRRRNLADGSQLENVIGNASYVPGELAIWKLLEARARRGDFEQLVAALEPWFVHLLKMAKAAPDNERASDAASASLASLVLPGDALDLTPFNLIDTGDDLLPIDQEWRVDHDIAMGWVVTRGVLYALTSAVGFETSAIAVVDVIRALAEHCGLGVAEADITGWLNLEHLLQEVVIGGPMQDIPLTQQGAKATPLHLLVTELEQSRAELAGALAQGKAELDSAHSALRNATGMLSQKEADSQKELAAWAEKVEVLKDEVTKSRVELSEAYAALQRSTETLLQNEEERRKNLAERDEQLAVLHKELAEERAELDSAQDGLRRATETLEKKEEEQRKELSARAGEVDSLSRELANKEAELGAALNALHGAEEVHQQKAAAIAQLVEQKAAAQQVVIDSQRNAMVSLENSRSWRITAPLRALRRAASRLKPKR